ncbi:MAG: hypothetical protein AAED33_14740 [Paracoccaceae bacterium]
MTALPIISLETIQAVLSHKLPRFARGVVYRQLVLMDTLTISYKRHPFPPEIIAHCLTSAPMGPNSAIY